MQNERPMVCCRLDLVTAGSMTASAQEQDDYNYQEDFRALAHEMLLDIPTGIWSQIHFINRDLLSGCFEILTTPTIWEKFEAVFLRSTDITSHEFVQVPENWRTLIRSQETAMFKYAAMPSQGDLLVARRTEHQGCEQ